MRLVIEASCGCNTGKIRKNNEDNFCFDGACLDVENNGLENPVYIKQTVKTGLSFAIFDGMGGENYGEIASFAAAKKMLNAKRKLKDWLSSNTKYLNRLSLALNEAVLEAKREQRTDRMGTTMVALHFSGRYAYVSNIGDSRAYRLRNGELLQISVDHVEHHPEQKRRKAPLTQHLGIDPKDMLIEPYIAKHKLQKGDMYLLCSDGLTDMLSNVEISCLMRESDHMDERVVQLIQNALDKGGRDNITVIVCKVI